MKKIYSLRLIVFAGLLFLGISGFSQVTYTYTGKPRFQILTTQSNATLGIINVELFPTVAPRHVRNFDSLVSQQFYDTTAFHRVVPGFVIQGGDPNSKSGPVSTWGYGQPWQPTVKAEFTVAKHERGILSAARSSNINSATSQFFICVAAATNLNGLYSIYGRVTSGMNIVDQIVNSPTVTGTQRPVNKVEMFVTYIGSNDTVPLAPVLTAPANDSSEVDTTIVVLKWNKVQDAVYYRLDVALDSLFNDTVKSMDINALAYGLYPLIKDTVYYWRVKTNNGGHITPSKTWHFRTGAKPVLNPIGVVEMDASKQRAVFPNPSRDGFTFTNTNPGEVIEIYSLDGRLIKSHAVKDRSVKLDTSDMIKGNYLYTIKSGQTKITEGSLVLAN